MKAEEEEKELDGEEKWEEEEEERGKECQSQGCSHKCNSCQ